MSDSILTTMAALPFGTQGSDLTWQQLGNKLRATVLGDAERENRKRAALRQEFYRGAGDRHMNEFIGRVFKDPEVREKRRDWVSVAKYNNVWRRVVNEKATSYNVPAIRRVSGDSDQERYEDLQRRCRQNDMARRWNRWGLLQRSLAVGFRVRVRGDVRTPVIDVVSRDSFFALGHPNDPSELVALGILIRQGTKEQPDRELWEVSTGHERFYCTRDGRINPQTVDVHEWPRMPWVLFSLEPPAGQLIDHDTGSEIDAAHQGVWFQSICLLKESKSATKITVVAGDTTRMAREQATDTELSVEVRDGTSVYALDMGMDLQQFIDTGSSIFESAASNEGIAPSVLKHQGVQSAEARELMRAPLMELRREQEDYLREFEREFVEVQSMVVAKDMPELSFATKGWSIDFQESSTPLDPKTALEVFEHARRLGLTSTIRELRKRNPDLSEEQAFDLMMSNISEEVVRNRLMKPLQQISGSMGAQVPTDDADPQSGELGDAGLRAINGGRSV